jgi:hypothetical protein
MVNNNYIAINEFICYIFISSHNPKIWEETVPKYFKGMNAEIDGWGKWAIDCIYERFEKGFPVYDFLEYSIASE